MTGRRENAKARTRAAIIEAGIRLMYAHGYEATSTTAIAKAAGVSPATLFNYFPTKASIVFADDHLWAPRPDTATAAATPHATLEQMILDLLEQPGWTRSADDELTQMRFDLVRGEPDLVHEQISRAFSLVPAFASIVRTAHPDLSEASALTQAGAVVGAVLAALLWGKDRDISTLVRSAINT